MDLTAKPRLIMTMATTMGGGDPHAHDWGVDANGEPVRGPGRPIKPNERVPRKQCQATQPGNPVNSSHWTPSPGPSQQEIDNAINATGTAGTVLLILDWIFNWVN